MTVIKICARLAGRLLGDPGWVAGPEAGGLLSGVGRHHYGSHYVSIKEGLVEKRVYLSCRLNTLSGRGRVG